LNIAAKSWITAYFVCFFFIWGIFLPFWGIWLSSKGVSPEQIGTLFSLGLVLRFISNIGLLPRLKSANAPVRMVCYLTFFSLVCLLLLIYFQGWYALAAATLLLNFLIAPMIPLGDIIGTRLVKQIQINYGQVRLWGSVSFIVGSTCIGWMIGEFGAESILWAMILAVFFNYFLSLIKLNPVLEQQAPRAKSSNDNLMTLLKQPKVVYFILVMGLIQGSHAAYYSFSALYWHSMGISEFNIALLWGISVFAEVLLMRFNDKLFHSWSVKKMCFLALIAGLIRWVVLAQTTNLGILMVVQTFHAFTFALAHLAAMRFIAMQEEHLMVGYQTLYSSVGLGLVMAVLTFISGWVYAPQESTLFLLMAIILLPVFFLLSRWKCDLND
jgi:MFS transporter, PPP family, 3-phenylpropionic acid transporter